MASLPFSDVDSGHMLSAARVCICAYIKIDDQLKKHARIRACHRLKFLYRCLILLIPTGQNPAILDSMLNMDWLHCLIELDRTGSVSGAARALHVTPSAVSQRLKALSKALGIEVVTSSTSGSSCTEAGRVLVQHGLQALSHLTAAEEAARALASTQQHEIAVACFPSGVGSLLPRIMKRISNEDEQLRVRFDVMTSHEIVKALQDGSVDIGLLARYPFDDPAGQGLHEVQLGRDELQVLLPREHSLALTDTVDLSDLEGVPVIVEGKNSQSCRSFLQTCDTESVNPKVVAYSPDAGVAIEMVAQGTGIAIVPGLAISWTSPNMVLRRLRPEVSRSIVVSCRTEAAERPQTLAFTVAAHTSWRAYELISRMNRHSLPYR